MTEFLEVIGALAPLTEAQVQQAFGTKTPGRDDVEAALYDLYEYCPRGTAVYAVLPLKREAARVG